MADEEFYTVRQAAERLGIHENTVRNWCDDGTLPFSRLPTKGAFRRIPAKAVEDLRLILRQPGFSTRRRIDGKVLEEIREAYDEARDSECSDAFLYGMRYVMRLLGMPEGISLNGDKGGTRTN